MEALIVLGIIPGTNIQIGFLGWAAVPAIVVAGLYIARRKRRPHTFRFWLIRMSLQLTIRRQRV